MKDEQKLQVGETGFDIHDREQTHPIIVEGILNNDTYITDMGTYEFYELVPKKEQSS